MKVLACWSPRLWRSFPSLFTGLAALAPLPGESGQIESITAIGGDRIALVLRIPEAHYAIVQQSDPADEGFRPIRIVRHPGTSSATVELSLPSTTGGTLWRFETIPEASPADTDGDGMNDLFELWRAHVLDPLNPTDAETDADWDGDSNLAEYLAGTEPAPPATHAPLFFPSLTALRARALLPLRGAVRINGYEREGDGWGGAFVWEDSGTEELDDAMFVALSPTEKGRLKRLVDFEDSLKASWWRPPTNGIDDAGPALQRALDALAGSSIRRLTIEPGRYRVDAVPAYYSPDEAPLHLDGLTDFAIDGTGAVIVTQQDGDMLAMQDCVRGIVRGLAFEGSGSDRGFPDHNYACVGLWGICSDLVFERCQFRQFMHGISHLRGEKTSTRITVRECYFEDGGDARHGVLDVDGAAVSGIGSEWIVEYNTIHECARGIEFENVGLLEPIRGTIVQGNRLTNVRNLGIMSFLGGVPPGTIQQSGNIIRDNVILGRAERWRRADGSAIPVMGIWLLGGHGWRIEGNRCETGDFAGIGLYAAQADVTDSLIRNNGIADMVGRGIQVVGALPFSARSIVVTNNSIRDCRGPGLLLGGEDMLAQGNFIHSAGTAGIAVAPALSAPSGPVRNVAVVRNMVIAPRWPDPSILIAADTENIRVEANDLRDAAIGIQMFSRDVTLLANTFSGVATPIWEPAPAAEPDPSEPAVPEPTPPVDDATSGPGPRPPGHRPPLEP